MDMEMTASGMWMDSCGNIVCLNVAGAMSLSPYTPHPQPSYAFIIRWYVLALNVHTYCMFYVFALKNSTCVAVSVVYGEWVNLAIVRAWHLVL